MHLKRRLGQSIGNQQNSAGYADTLGQLTDFHACKKMKRVKCRPNNQSEYFAN
jgi:hypothetical protein